MYTHTIDFQLQSKTSKDYAVFVMTEKVKSTPTRSELEDKYNVYMFNIRACGLNIEHVHHVCVLKTVTVKT